jgi:type IV secretion system protein VirD4
MADEFWSQNRGIYFGYGSATNRGEPPQCTPDNEIRYIGDRHIVTVGPNGSGKTRRTLLPALAELTGWSMLVVDPKGELAAMTRKHRQANGNRIVTLNPFDTLELGSDGFNPVASLDPEGRTFPDDAMRMAEALIRVEGNEPHWSQSAQDLVCSLIMYARIALPNPSLADVRHILGMSSGRFKELIEEPKTEYRAKKVYGILCAAHVFKCPEIENKISRFVDVGPDNKEMLGIVSTALTQTRWIDSREIGPDLSKGGFDFAAMKREPTTVFLILPADRLGSHANWLRLMITCVLQPLIRETRDRKVPVLFVLDEFAQLGHLPIIEQNMAMTRGYGIKLWTVLQDLGQLKAIYGDKWESFINNSGVLHSFAPQDVFTSEYLSKLSGQTTETPLAASIAADGSVSLNVSQLGLPLLLPQEFRKMSDGFAALFSHKLRDDLAYSYFPYPAEIEHLKEIAALDPS